MSLIFELIICFLSLVKDRLSSVNDIMLTLLLWIILELFCPTISLFSSGVVSNFVFRFMFASTTLGTPLFLLLYVYERSFIPLWAREWSCDLNLHDCLVVLFPVCWYQLKRVGAIPIFGFLCAHGITARYQIFHVLCLFLKLPASYSNGMSDPQFYLQLENSSSKSQMIQEHRVYEPL